MVNRVSNVDFKKRSDNFRSYLSGTLAGSVIGVSLAVTTALAVGFKDNYNAIYAGALFAPLIGSTLAGAIASHIAHNQSGGDRTVAAPAIKRGVFSGSISSLLLYGFMTFNYFVGHSQGVADNISSSEAFSNGGQTRELVEDDYERRSTGLIESRNNKESKLEKLD